MADVDVFLNEEWPALGDSEALEKQLEQCTVRNTTQPGNPPQPGNPSGAVYTFRISAEPHSIELQSRTLH